MEKFPFSSVQMDETKSTQTERLRLVDAFYQATDLGMLLLNTRGEIASMNKTAEVMLGQRLDTLAGKTPEPLFDLTQFDKLKLDADNELFHEAVLPRLLHEVRTTSRTCRFETVAHHKNGTPIPVALGVTGLWERNTIAGYAITFLEISERKKAEREQHENQKQLKAVIASLDDIVFELDTEGRFREIWVRSDDFLFLPREKVLGHTLSEMFGEEFARPFEEGLREVIRTGDTFQWEYPSMKPGDNRWFNAKCSLVIENGEPTGRMSVCIQDITVRKEMEMSLRESEEKFRLLAESIPGVIFMIKNDSANTVQYINNKITLLTGYAVEDFYSGKVNLLSLVHKDDRDYVINIRKKSLEDRVSYTLEYRLLHRDKIWRWVSETGIGVQAGQGFMLEGFLSDITQRKESEEELRRMADENSRIFNNSITLTAVTGFDGYFKKLNPAWEKTLGWSRDELLTKPINEFIHPEDLVKTEEMMRVVCTGHTIAMFENRYRCKDGTYRWLLWGSSPDIARKVVYASAIDITSRKKFEEELIISKRNLEVAAYELEEQNRQLDEFAHIISHNLRAPVSNIKALLNFITEDSQPGDYQLIFEKIRNVTHNIGETMNELMEMIKIRKTHDIERVEIRFKDILDKVVQSLEGELIEAGATVTYNFNNAPKIYYSKPYLESILQNLISNAVKYRSPKRIPEIFVSTDLIPSGIELRVRDNGLGIDLKQHGDKLFGLHKTFHENKEARGVGLFLTKTQIETLGGSVKVESKVDEGTTFIIHF